MIKKIAYIVLGMLLLAYVLFAVVFPKDYLEEKQCEEVTVLIVDTLERHFISEKDIFSALKQAGLYPVGKPLREIDTDKMEACLETNKLIKQVVAYKTAGGSVKIKIRQRIPLFRVIGVNGDFYVDTEGQAMPVVSRYAAYVPLVTGHVSKDFAKGDLCRLARYLHENKFWDAQIEQIYVHPDQEVELTPRVGNHQIVLGKLDNFEEKLDNLRLFYERALDKAGWNRYSKINLKFKNQIVCTRR